MTVLSLQAKKRIRKKRIKTIKKRHFSATKTVLLPIGIVVVFVGLIVASYSGPDIGGGMQMPPWNHK